MEVVDIYQNIEKNVQSLKLSKTFFRLSYLLKIINQIIKVLRILKNALQEYDFHILK